MVEVAHVTSVKSSQAVVLVEVVAQATAHLLDVAIVAVGVEVGEGVAASDLEVVAEEPAVG